jgi:DNA-binding NtrC family response regulator
MDSSIEILVVDDEAIAGKRLKTALEKEKYAVEVVDSGEGALSRLQEKEFDVVVTDIRMHDVDGIQVLDEVRKRHPKTKTILITGYATVEVAREALAKGAFDFIAKPFQPKDLRVIVEKAVKQLRKERG